MTKEEKIAILKDIIDGEIIHPQVRRDVGIWAIKALEQEPSYNSIKTELKPCEDAISRRAVIDGINRYFHDEYYQRTSIQDCRDCLIEDVINKLPAVNPQPKAGHCKDCKYFEYDSVAKVDGIPIPLIVAHEICKRWGNGCKTKEDGYCFMFEPQESEG